MGKRDWVEAIESHLDFTDDTPGDGWETTAEIAAQMGMTNSGVRYRLKKLVAMGEAEARMFRLGSRQMRHYRLVGE